MWYLTDFPNSPFDIPALLALADKRAFASDTDYGAFATKGLHADDDTDRMEEIEGGAATAGQAIISFFERAGWLAWDSDLRAVQTPAGRALSVADPSANASPLRDALETLLSDWETDDGIRPWEYAYRFLRAFRTMPERETPRLIDGLMPEEFASLAAEAGSVDAATLRERIVRRRQLILEHCEGTVKKALAEDGTDDADGSGRLFYMRQLVCESYYGDFVAEGKEGLKSPFFDRDENETDQLLHRAAVVANYFAATRRFGYEEDAMALPQQLVLHEAANDG